MELLASVNESSDHDLLSNYFLEQTRKINIFSIMIILFIGLIGNFLTIFVFSQNRFRTNSSNVYLLCLAIVDAAFLILHLFEDTVRTYNDIYVLDLNETSFLNASNVFNDFIQFINITDKSELACCLINYFRNILRFISAFIIVAFTLQRLTLVYSPLSNNFKTKKSAWSTVLIITAVSILINSWVPFMFELKQTSKDRLNCDVIDYWRREYFIITSVYIAMIMLIPIITIFLSNSLILNKTSKADRDRQHLQMKLSSSTSQVRLKSRSRMDSSVKNNNLSVRNRRTSFGFASNCSQYLSIGPNQTHSNFKLKPYYPSFNNVDNKILIKADNSKRLKNILILISFSYAILNFPYLITWSVFFFEITFNKLTTSSENYLFGAVQLSEIFYIFNYGLKFYIYCASGSMFRNQLKNSSNLFSSFLFFF